MAIEIKLPDLGDGIDSGDILEVLVQEGEVIEKDQSIVEIETDKATVEVPSTEAGKVTAIHVSSGQSVPIGAPLISVETSEAKSSESEPASPEPEQAEQKQKAEETQQAEEPQQAEEAQQAEEKQQAEETQQTEEPQQAEKQTAAAEQSPPPSQPESPAPAQATASSQISSSDTASTAEMAPAGPAVRRFAREVGVDLAHVKGSGPGGRITRDDVLAVVRRSGQTAPTPTKSTPSTSSTSPNQSASAKAPVAGSKATRSGGPAVEGEAASDNWGPIRVQKMAKIRKTIANKMHESWSTVPRVTNFDDADVTELEAMRQASKADYAETGVKLTTMPFIIKAVALALKSNPLINAAVDMQAEQIIYKEYVNIGVAVDTERGLVVPSLRNADQLSIPAIARGLSEIANNARNGNFAIDDLRGSTFTISNLGAIGGTYSTPIINTPEVAILLVGRSRKMPIIVNDEIKIRLMMPLSLSYDHRLVDGGAAARFLNDAIGFLSMPSRLLIAP